VAGDNVHSLQRPHMQTTRRWLRRGMAAVNLRLEVSSCAWQRQVSTTLYARRGAKRQRENPSRYSPKWAGSCPCCPCQAHLHTNATSTHTSLACLGASDGWHWQGRYSRSDLCLHEDKNEDQEGRDGRGKHHPHWKGPSAAHGVNEPATLVRRCDRQARGDIQFLVV